MSEQYVGQDAVELFKSLAKSQDNSQTQTRTGLITSVDAATNMAKVMLVPEGIETGWLPISTIGCGNGWGVFHLPLRNTECSVTFADGSVENGRIIGFHSNAQDAPPAGLVPGEFLLQHQSGSLLHFDNQGNVNIVTQNNLTATVGGNVLLSSQGDVTATIQGDLTVGVNGDLTATVFGDVTAAALGDVDCSAEGDASLSGTNVTITAATGVEITGATDVVITSAGAITLNGPTAITSVGPVSVTCGDLTAIAASLMATITGAAAIAAASVVLGTGTTIDGVDFLLHTHSAVQTGAGVSGPVVPP